MNKISKLVLTLVACVSVVSATMAQHTGGTKGKTNHAITAKHGKSSKDPGNSKSRTTGRRQHGLTSKHGSKGKHTPTPKHTKGGKPQLDSKKNGHPKGS